MEKMRREFNLPGLFYVDTWPLSVPLMIISEPSVAAQITQSRSLPKHPLVMDVLRGLIGDHSIFSTEGQEWRALRSMFNPGFSLAHLMTLVPFIADEVMIFHNKLQEFAKTGETFPMNERATYLTIDVIGKVMMGEEFNSQTSHNDIVATFMTAMNCTWAHTDIPRKVTHAPLLW